MAFVVTVMTAFSIAVLAYIAGFVIGRWTVELAKRKEEETEIKLMYLQSIDGDQAKKMLETLHKSKRI